MGKAKGLSKFLDCHSPPLAFTTIAFQSIPIPMLTNTRTQIDNFKTTLLFKTQMLAFFSSYTPFHAVNTSSRKEKNCYDMEGTSSSSTKHDDDVVEIFPISDDEKYAEEIQLQEALFSSTISSTTIVVNKEIQVIDLEIDNVNDTLLRKLKLKEKETFEGESSSSSSQLKQISYCGICMEVKPTEEMFENRNCSHSFCEDCVGTYLAAKIQENISMVKCPDPKCNGILEPYNCISIIPKDVFDRWGNALCENMVIGSQKFYCPFNDCSAMLVNDEEEAVTVAECPHCHRLFCAQCKVSWHAGVDCSVFQSLKDGERGREDLMAMELAKNERWKRCPKCSFYVEKSEGCTRISCRCGNQFCYGCGSTWNNDSHYSCATR